MNRTITTIAMLIVPVALLMTTSPARSESLDEIIKASIAASGGESAIGKIKTLTRKGTLAIDAMGQTMDGSIESTIIPWKKAHQTMDIGGFMQMTTAWNGEVAWEDGMQGLRELDGPEGMAARQAADGINPFLGYKMSGADDVKMTKLEDELLDFYPHFVIEVTVGEGSPIKFYVGQDNHLITRMVTKQDVPQFGMATITIDNLYYKDFEGVQLPTMTVMSMGDMAKIEMSYSETLLNEEVDESIFNMPEPTPAAGATATAGDSQ